MKTTIGVFFGGRSVEHEISVISALQAIAALDEARYAPVPVYITKSGRWLTGEALLEAANYRDMAALERRATEVWMRPEYGNRRLYRRGGLGSFGGERVVAELDVALPVLHGTNGEDGTFQGLLELIGIPYVGCNVLSSAVGMDKIAMKMMLGQSGIPVIDYVWFTDRQWGSEREKLIVRVESEIGYPAIVKPANLGSSVGISRARNREELVRAVGEAVGYSSRIIVERMIEPLREINCSVLGSADDHRASVCEEPVRSGEILSYTDKYMSGGGGAGAKGGACGVGAKGGAGVSAGLEMSKGASVSSASGISSGSVSSGMSEGMSSTKRRIPADLPEAVTAEIQRLAAETFRVLGCEGVARVDFILDGNTVYVNEINAIPGSLSFYLWEATGVPFGAMLDSLVSQALKRERDKGHKTVSYPANIFSMGSPGGPGSKGGAKGGFGGSKGGVYGSKGGSKK
jgi:D-alanine-D-alanine ligase